MKLVLYVCICTLWLGIAGHGTAAYSKSVVPKEPEIAFPECAQESSKAGVWTRRKVEKLRAKVLERRATIEELRSGFTNTNIFHIASHINRLMEYSNRAEVVELMRAVWSGHVDDYPDFSWACLRHPVVRVSLAQVLARGDPSNYATYYRYITDHLDDHDTFVRAGAVGALARIGSDREVPTLERFALSDDGLVARNAVAGLFIIASDAARKAIERLYDNPRLAPEVKHFIEAFDLGAAANSESMTSMEPEDPSPECLQGSWMAENGAQREDRELRAKILERRATFEELRGALTKKNIYNLASYISLMLRYKNRAEVMELLRAVWNDHMDGYPNFSWGCLRHPLVRVSLAQVLARTDQSNFDTYYEYIKSHLTNYDPDVRASAATALGLIGSDRDVPTLEKLVLSDNKHVASGAISGLFGIKSDAAKQAIERLYNNPTVDREAKHLIETYRNLP